MPAEITVLKIDRTERSRRLLKEAFSLSKEIAEIDTRVDHDIRKINGDFAVSLEEIFDDNPNAERAAGFAKDELREKSIGFIFSRMAKALKLGFKEIPGLGIALDVMSADKGASYRAAYFDTRPGVAADLESKKRRLHDIMLEFSNFPSVPIQLNHVDFCKHEACWQQRR